MRIRPLLTAALLSPTLLAQGPPTFVAKADALVQMTVDDLPTLLAQLPSTRFGKLLADDEVAPAIARCRAEWGARRQWQAEVLRTAIDLRVDITPWDVSVHAASLFTLAWDRFALADLKRLTFSGIYAAGYAGLAPRPRSLLTVQVHPRIEGKATQAFDAVARDLERSGWLVADPAAKLDGLPLHAFGVRPPTNGEDEPLVARNQPLGAWLAHLPGTFVFGTGAPAECGALAPDQPRDAGATMRIDVGSYLALITQSIGQMPSEVTALGIDQIRTLQWQLHAAGDLLLEELRIELAPAPTGVLAALLTGTAALPTQALPDGSLLQVRFGADPQQLCAAIAQLAAGNVPIEYDVMAAVQKAITGGIAVGVGAPAPGGVVPRLFATLGLADPATAEGLLAQLRQAIPGTKTVALDGTECTVVGLGPAMPAAFQPTLCVRNGQLFAAESIASLRALLQAQTDGVEAMAAAAPAAAAGSGPALPGFDLRWDEAAMYGAFRDRWLPLFELASSTDATWFQPLAKREDLPAVDVVESYLGAHRATLHRDGDAYVVRMAGTFGGPELAALAMTFGPIVSGQTAGNWSTTELVRRVGQRRLQHLSKALAEFEQREHRRPKDLGELVAAAGLPDDALLLPGDTTAEPVAMANGTPARRSSFRYFPATTPVDIGTGTARALLIELQPRPYYRLVLTDDGSLPEIYGEVSNRPIDEFGK